MLLLLRSRRIAPTIARRLVITTRVRLVFSWIGDEPMSATPVARLGNVGTVIQVPVVDENGDAIDISNATLRRILLLKPNRELLTKTALLTTNGVDGYMEYHTVAGDLDLLGRWTVQAYVEFADGDHWHGDIGAFQVGRVLS